MLKSMGKSKKCISWMDHHCCICLFKMGKLEDQRFKIWIQSVGFVLFAFYLRTLKDNIAYVFVFITAICYLAYRYYMLSLDSATK